jgi:TonB family protein
MKTLLCILLISFTACGTILAQDSTRDRGIGLFNQGDFDESAAVLEKASLEPGAKTDARLWNYLGLAYLKKGEIKKSRIALEKAVKLEPGNLSARSYLAYAYFLDKQEKKARAEIQAVISQEPKNVWAYYVRCRININSGDFDDAILDAEKILNLDPDNPQARSVMADAIFGKVMLRVMKGAAFSNERGLLQKAGDILRECLRSCKNRAEAHVQQEKLEIIEAFTSAADRLEKNDNGKADDASGDFQRPRIISKPRASFTSEARKNNITGMMKVSVLLGADGRVRYVIPLNRLGFGLDEEVLRAASEIKFVPATKKGVPVPYVVTITYGFDIR